jgi:hypothetical protein
MTSQSKAASTIVVTGGSRLSLPKIPMAEVNTSRRIDSACSCLGLVNWRLWLERVTAPDGNCR